MAYETFELLTQDGGAALVEIKLDAETGRVFATWDDTRAAAWDGNEFGWVYSFPGDAAPIPAATVRQGILRDDIAKGTPLEEIERKTRPPLRIGRSAA